MTKLWGSGGPMPILSQLYQVLNSFIHRGPFLARESPLGRHIRLDALILQLRVAEPDPEEPSEYMRYDDVWPVEELEKDLHVNLEVYISRVVDRGLLFGAVDQIVFRFAGETTKWEVSRQKIGDMREWNAYHFDWGVPGSSSLEASGEFPQPKPEPSQSNAPDEDF
ncbi:hypothetical protein B0H14DRAFT_1390934 [Mycena olivaceomarginata]|nr:hypothetical protein B0H14DRAFT_1390934 [Mycena olivaceomarginata]